MASPDQKEEFLVRIKAQPDADVNDLRRRIAEDGGVDVLDPDVAGSGNLMSVKMTGALAQQLKNELSGKAEIVPNVQLMDPGVIPTMPPD
ncbi:hypothetical protein [Methylobacterium sp. ID0610]|uniref:hypothetical protein n=1 Tax=Methylobacterium carpenticola TaxID=3344827 RepID=UPI0036A873F2